MNHMPLIFEIKGNSLDDGPGIRSVVFFKGCPLSCAWCHNPEGRSIGVEIGFEEKECVGCDTCLGICPESALDRENPFFIDRERCSLCFECVSTCPSGALRRIGESLLIEEILAKIMPYKPFFDTSGGGVTLSGGEPTMSMDSASSLLRALKDVGIHTVLETCGQFDLTRFFDMIYPYVDVIYYDLKLIDPHKHKQWCGTTNATILGNFRALSELFQRGGVVILPRTPLIPGITDGEENLAGIAGFLRESGIQRAQVLPCHPLWLDKCRAIGREAPSSYLLSQDTWLSRDRLKSCIMIFNRAGIDILS